MALDRESRNREEDDRHGNDLCFRPRTELKRTHRPIRCACAGIGGRSRNHHCRQSTSPTRRRDDSHAGTAAARAQGAAMLQDRTHDDSVLNSPQLSLSHLASKLVSHSTLKRNRELHTCILDIALIEKAELDVSHMNLFRSGSSPSYQTNAIAATSQLIQNRLGLHARPAAMFVRVANKHRANIWVQKDGQRVNGKSILGLMTLAAGQGTRVVISAEGVDAENSSKNLKCWFRGGSMRNKPCISVEDASCRVPRLPVIARGTAPFTKCSPRSSRSFRQPLSPR